MDPILPFIKEFKDNIIGITLFADYAYDNQETSIEVKNIEIKNNLVYFIGKEDVIGIPVDGAIVNIDHENGETNLITVFNKKYGYIKTKKFSF